MNKSFSSGKALRRIGLTILVVGLLIGLVLRFVPDRDWNEALTIFSFLPVLMIVGGAFMFFRGRQHATQAAAETILYDGKPDVLYLRPFKTDPSVAGQAFSALLTATLMSGMATQEEQLAEVLKPFGDLVAIGRPGESLPKPGAAKLYASNEEWQRVVVEQMQAARLVVIRAGIAAGVLWELEKAREILQPKKLLVLILGMNKKNYESFRNEAKEMLDISLPERKRLKKSGGVAGFFRFSEDWTPEFLPLYAPKLRRSSYKPFRVLFKYALKPVFADFGLDWVEPPLSKLMIGVLTFLSLIGLLVLVAIISSL